MIGPYFTATMNARENNFINLRLIASQNDPLHFYDGFLDHQTSWVIKQAAERAWNWTLMPFFREVG